MPVSCICQAPTCGKLFYVAPSRIEKGVKYCSWACRISIAIQCICENMQCRKTFIVAPSIAKKGKRFCSRHCRTTAISVSERFWSKILMCEHGEMCPYCCWPWTDALSNGYGRFKITINGKGRQVPAHTMAWQLVNNRMIPAGYYGLHHCDFPRCCSPWHVYAGTPQDNINDAIRRNRIHKPRGEQNPRAKLKEKDIKHIWAMRKEGKTTREIALELDVIPYTIELILKWRHWSHISCLYSDGPAQAIHPSGEKNAQSKLTPVDIKQIWIWHSQGLTNAEMGRRLRVSSNTIYSILSYKTWAHISRSLSTSTYGQLD